MQSPSSDGHAASILVVENLRQSFLIMSPTFEESGKDIMEIIDSLDHVTSNDHIVKVCKNSGLNCNCVMFNVIITQCSRR